MPAFLVAFPDDPLEKTEYNCAVVPDWIWTLPIKRDTWAYIVSSRKKRKVQDGDICHWECDESTNIYTKLGYLTQLDAANAAREWCKNNGINHYTGPVMSGQIG